MATYQEILFKLAAAGCLLTNYGRLSLGDEVS